MRRRWGRGHRYKRHPREGSGRGGGEEALPVPAGRAAAQLPAASWRAGPGSGPAEGPAGFPHRRGAAEAPRPVFVRGNIGCFKKGKPISKRFDYVCFSAPRLLFFPGSTNLAASLKRCCDTYSVPSFSFVLLGVMV